MIVLDNSSPLDVGVKNIKLSADTNNYIGVNIVLTNGDSDVSSLDPYNSAVGAGAFTIKDSTISKINSLQNVKDRASIPIKVHMQHINPGLASMFEE